MKERINMGVGQYAIICSVALKPSITGILISMVTTSGFSFCTNSIALSPFSAIPTACINGSVSSIFFNISLIRPESSTISTLIFSNIILLFNNRSLQRRRERKAKEVGKLGSREVGLPPLPNFSSSQPQFSLRPLWLCGKVIPLSTSLSYLISYSGQTPSLRCTHLRLLRYLASYLQL